ncbi:MAG: hypothetical protein DRR42_03675 [Gammaproteobacteria bacterium]|nr:MAG: hypothetical protein DRR42_03675 [Gammaproteobacteria bacterium]
MGIHIQRDILGLEGQCVNKIKLDEEEQQLVICCRRGRRRNAIDPVIVQKGTVNRYVRRQVRDVPLFGYPCMIDMELAQVFISTNERRMEHREFVDKGLRFTRRFSHDQRIVPPHQHSCGLQAFRDTLGDGEEYRQGVSGGYPPGARPDTVDWRITSL